MPINEKTMTTADCRPALRGGRGWWVAVLMGLFWLSLPWLDYPGAVSCDDLIFVAPALDFAHGRPMTAHIVQDVCLQHGIDPGRWLSHTPVYQQILGTWLRVFGISHVSMLWFQAAVSLGIYGGLLALLRQFGLHAGWSVPISVLVASAEIRCWGLRPEAVGLLFILLGLVCFLRRSIAGGFLAGLCWVAAGAVVQQAGIYSGLFFLAGLAEIVRSQGTGRRERALAMFAGGIVPVFCFLQGIGWDVPGFLHVYGGTLQRAGGMSASRAHVLHHYWLIATCGWEWLQVLVMAPLFGVLAVGVFATKERFHRALLLTVAVGVIVNLLIVQAFFYRVAFIYVMAGGAAFFILGSLRRRVESTKSALRARSQSPDWECHCPRNSVSQTVDCRNDAQRWSYPFCAKCGSRIGDSKTSAFPIGDWERARMAVVRGLGAGLAVVCSVGVLALGAPGVYGHFCQLPGNADAVRRAIATHRHRAIYLDYLAAAYLFDWQLPEGAQSTWHSKRQARVPAQPGELFIMQESIYQPKPLRLFGREFRSVDLNNKRWEVVDYRGNSLLSGKPVGLDLTAY